MRVLFFAHLTDVTGCREAEFQFAAPVGAAKLWQEMILRFPKLDGFRGSVRLARNCEYADPDARFTDADEVALIPPVAGG